MKHSDSKHALQPKAEGHSHSEGAAPVSDVAPVAAIRAHFPALARQQGGKPVAYFDGPGGTQVPGEVVDAMTDYLLHHNANTHWCYPTSVETDAAIAGARQALGDLFGASPREVAFGNNMTTLTFHVARALGRQWGRTMNRRDRPRSSGQRRPLPRPGQRARRDYPVRAVRPANRRADLERA